MSLMLVACHLADFTIMADLQALLLTLINSLYMYFAAFTTVAKEIKFMILTFSSLLLRRRRY